jgi:hypothetical protein
MKTTLKLFILLSFTAFIILPAHAQDKRPDPESVKVEKNQKDTTEYEIKVLTPGYESYLMNQPSKNFYTKGYYESWNERYVREWNYRYMNQPDGIYQSYIDYDPGIDYGLEFEYRLYYFFQFMEDINNIRLIPRR